MSANTQWDATAVAVSASSNNLLFTILSVEDKDGIFGCERNRVIQRDIKAKQKRERQQTLPCVSEAFSSWKGCRVTSIFADFSEDFSRETWWNVLGDKEVNECFQSLMSDFVVRTEELREESMRASDSQLSSRTYLKKLC